MKKIILLSLVSFNLMATSDFYGDMIPSKETKMTNDIINVKYRENPNSESIDNVKENDKFSTGIYYYVKGKEAKEKVKEAKELRKKRMKEAHYITDRVVYEIFLGGAGSKSDYEETMKYGVDFGASINYITQWDYRFKLSLETDISIFKDYNNMYIISPGIKYRPTERFELSLNGDLGFIEGYGSSNPNFSYGANGKLDIYLIKNISGFFKYSYLTNKDSDYKTMKLGISYHF